MKMFVLQVMMMIIDDCLINADVPVAKVVQLSFIVSVMWV